MEPQQDLLASVATSKTNGLEVQQFVTFLIDDELFGVPMQKVLEIIRMPSLVHVPLCPPSLEGLATLRGRVLPVINLRASFRLPPQEHGEATRVIVADCGTLVGFVVDRVASVISVERDRIEAAESIKSTVNTDLVTGLIKPLGVTPPQMTVLLDVDRVLRQEFSALSVAKLASTAGTIAAAAEQASDDSNTKAGEIQLVSFQVAQQEYAFPIQRVQEIVQVPDGFCQIPNAGSHVLGVMTLRERLLPIVSLREMFGLPRGELSESNRIVVLSLDDAQNATAAMVGIVMDGVKEVLRLPASSVDPLPGLLARDPRIREVDSICRLDGGKRLVTVLSVERMFEHDAVTEALSIRPGSAEEGKATDMDHKTASTLDDEEQMVVFRLGDEEYCVQIAEVQEILRLAEHFTHVPKSADFIEGLVSLRGTVLPVVDLRRRFGLPQRERDERQRVMVLSVNDVRTGVIVDAVTEVLKVAARSFEPAPALSETQANVIRRVANLEGLKRMILVLEAGKLFDEQERTALSRAA